jgi:hypothetical protein
MRVRGEAEYEEIEQNAKEPGTLGVVFDRYAQPLGDRR